MGKCRCMGALGDVIRPHLTMKTVSGATLRTGSTTVTPIARLLVVGWRNVALVWNRPVAVLAFQEGRTSRLRIFDLTRVVQLSIVAAAVLGACWIASRSSGQEEMSP